jgi:hypothetical protein
MAYEKNMVDGQRNDSLFCVMTTYLTTNNNEKNTYTEMIIMLCQV